ncbi:trypsin-like peptidase domain-containing protein [Rhodovulum sp. DZ06]|uniref:trypsin-like peptidase domain-containing protein n=1 Tax=Rhodovulum sp. DZ06 TaxID=3425126 RepID=UPI003D340082
MQHAIPARPSRSRRAAAALAAAALALPVLALGAAPVAAETRQVPQNRAEISLSFAPVVKKAAPAVVNIYARKSVERARSPFMGDPFFERFFQRFAPPSRRMENALGSGVIVSPDGLVVSNHHVVGGAEEIRVVLADRREYEAELVLSDEDSDLAVLRLADAADLPALELLDSDELEVGDLVLAIGNPFGVGQTVTSGIVSGLARSGGAGGRGDGYFIQTDAAINPGNSGGALVDMEGRLAGVNTSILTRSGGSNGIGFAVPANLVAQVVAQAEAGRSELARPWSGVAAQTVTGELAEAMGLERPEGVLLRGLHRLSPFAAAGLRRGDVVVAVDGRPVASPQELDFRLAARGVGAKATVDYLRGREAGSARVALFPAPEDPPADIRRIRGRSPFMDLAVGNLSPALAGRVGAPEDAEGVVVLEAGPMGRRNGWRPGDIIRKVDGRAVDSTRTLDRIADERRSRWEVEIERDGRRGALRFRG